MYKKIVRLYNLIISYFLHPNKIVLAYINKLFVIDFHAPGAQGGTGGW